MVFAPQGSVMSCRSSLDFRAWLAKNHSQSAGILLRIYKKDSGVATVTIIAMLARGEKFH